MASLQQCPEGTQGSAAHRAGFPQWALHSGSPTAANRAQCSQSCFPRLCSHTHLVAMLAPSHTALSKHARPALFPISASWAVHHSQPFGCEAADLTAGLLSYSVSPSTWCFLHHAGFVFSTFSNFNHPNTRLSRRTLPVLLRKVMFKGTQPQEHSGGHTPKPSTTACWICALCCTKKQKNIIQDYLKHNPWFIPGRAFSILAVCATQPLIPILCTLPRRSNTREQYFAIYFFLSYFAM